MTNKHEIKIGDLLYDENRFGLVIKKSKTFIDIAGYDTLYYIEWNDGRVVREGQSFVRYARNQASAIKKRLKRKT